MSFILHTKIMKEMIKVNLLQVKNKNNIYDYIKSLNKNDIVSYKANVNIFHNFSLLDNKYYIYQTIFNNNIISCSKLIGITFCKDNAINLCNKYNLMGENSFSIHINEIQNKFFLNNLTKENKEKLYYISNKEFIDIYNIKLSEYYNIANFSYLQDTTNQKHFQLNNKSE